MVFADLIERLEQQIVISILYIIVSLLGGHAGIVAAVLYVKICFAVGSVLEICGNGPKAFGLRIIALEHIPKLRFIVCITVRKTDENNEQPVCSDGTEGGKPDRFSGQKRRDRLRLAQ